MRNRRSRVRRVDDGPPDDTLLTLPDDTSAVEDHWPDDAHTSHKRGSDNCTDQKKDRWQTTHSNGATDEAHP